MTDVLANLNYFTSLGREERSFHEKMVIVTYGIIFPVGWVLGTDITEVSAASKTGTTSDGFSYKISKDNTVEITKYKGKRKKLEFPDKIKGKKVTKIGKAAVKGNKYVTSIKVPDSVKTVEISAFENCKNLTIIRLGKSVKEIGTKEDVYKNPYSIELGKKFKAFEVSPLNKAFYAKDGVLFERDKISGELYLLRCPPAKKGTYQVPEGISSVMLLAFKDSQLSTIIFPASVKGIIHFFCYDREGSCESKIAEYKVDEANEKYYAKDGGLFEKAYEDYDYPKGDKLIHYPPEKRDVSYQVPENIVKVEECAFEKHKYLEEVEIPNAYIMYDAFQGCKKLKKAVLSEEMADGAFARCEKLTGVEFRNQDKKITISEDAFRGSGLKSIILPENVTVIEKMAFNQYQPLKWIEIRNKDCHIDMLDAGMRNKTVIYGYPDSTAEKFAKKAGQKFRVIGEPRPEEDFSGTVTRDTIKLSQTSYTYDGKEKKPKVVVKDKFGNKVKDYYYKVTYKNNKNVGEAVVRVKFDNYAYAGTIQTTFVIKPPKSRITKLTSGKNDITLQWSGVKPSQISGYEIQYATSDEFKKENTQTVQVNKRDAAKKQIKNLEQKKTYYVRIRSYKNIKREGKPERLYSKWSDKKKVKI